MQNIPDFSGLKAGCGFCGSRENLLQCSKCRVMVYCDRKHQIAHLPRHKEICTAIKAARDALEQAEAKFRASSDKDPTVHITNDLSDQKRKYIDSRVQLFTAISFLGTREGLQQILPHFMEILRLNPKDDHCGVCNSIPAIMLRLGRDRECYAFLKSWNMIYKESCDIWSRPELPRFNVEGVDVFESVDEFLVTKDGCTTIAMIVPLCLMKVRIFLDGFFSLCQGGISALDEDTFLPGIFQSLQLQLGSNNLHNTEDFWSHPRFADKESRLATMKLLASQIQALSKNVDEMNIEFWPSLLHPKPLDPSRDLNFCPALANLDQYDLSNPPPGLTDFMNHREASFVCRWNYASWRESNCALMMLNLFHRFPQALDMIADETSVREAVAFSESHLGKKSVTDTQPGQGEQQAQ